MNSSKVVGIVGVVVTAIWALTWMLVGLAFHNGDAGLVSFFGGIVLALSTVCLFALSD